MLYTDDDVVIKSYRRVIMLNGINKSTYSPDLVDRAIIFRMQRINKKNRKTERELLSEYEKLKPQILGEIFTILSKAIPIFEGLNLKELPRMADFAEWGEAISQAMGHKPNEFLSAYLQITNQQSIDLLEGNIVATLIRQHLEMQQNKEWTGTMSQLYSILLPSDPQKNAKKSSFPKDPSALSRKINTLKVPLESIDIYYEPEFKLTGERKEVKLWISTNQDTAKPGG